MIKANELRIGNWITCMYGTYPVIDVMCDGLNLPHVEGLPYDEADGVILTEEWLIKAGFEQTESTFWLDNFGVNNENFEFNTKPLFYYELSSGKRAYLSFVHDLQNLFYALKREELTFNLQ